MRKVLTIAGNRLANKVCLLLAGCLILSTSCSEQGKVTDHKPDLPKVWVTYKGEKPSEEFPDLRKHGVGAISVNKPSQKILGLARENDLKLILSIPEITESAYRIPPGKVERAVMIAGAYEGKAIDRFRFSFTPEKHTILIESPRYDKKNCYKTLGKYFPGMHPPVKAEVIVKQADFDGQQHLKIIPAQVGLATDSLHWPVSFDLTGVTGDLDHVGIAVYWISEGTRSYWMFGDAASPASDATKQQFRTAVRKLVDDWAAVNDGSFPSGDVLAVRIGDECFHLSGHVNCQACSYPLWDFSQSTVNEYKKLTSLEYPRGKSFPDMYGRDAYSLWLYNYHRLNAGLMKIVRDELDSLGLPNVLTFRNITRFNVYHPLNDLDGSGLDLLSQNLDIVHIDPYPINAGGYREDVIPVDMAYVAGLARRHHKYLVPWLQAHQYWPEFGGLAHPGPDDVKKMVNQHLEFNPDAIMWLGYGEPPFSTFPYENPKSWEKAGEMNHQFIQSDKPAPSATFAVLRPYNVRALRDIDSAQKMDRFFTDGVLTWLSLNHIFFDPFEPTSLQSIHSPDLNQYKYIIAEAGKLDEGELNILSLSRKPAIVFIYEADNKTFDASLTGIRSFGGRKQGNFTVNLPESDIQVYSYDRYQLDGKANILALAGRDPVIWKKDNLIFVSMTAGEDANGLMGYLMDILALTEKKVL